MDIVFTCLKVILVLTVATEAGFLVQRSYCNILIVILSSTLAVLAGAVTFVYPVLSAVAGVIVYFYSLCKFGEVKLMPDGLLAGFIAIGGVVLFFIHNITSIFF